MARTNREPALVLLRGGLDSSRAGLHRQPLLRLVQTPEEMLAVVSERWPSLNEDERAAIEFVATATDAAFALVSDAILSVKRRNIA